MFYLAAARQVAPGLYRLRDMAPDRFYQGEYYRNYYAQTGLAEEIDLVVLRQSIAALAQLPQGTYTSKVEIADGATTVTRLTSGTGFLWHCSPTHAWLSAYS